MNISHKTKFRILIIATCIYATFLFYLSHQPSVPTRSSLFTLIPFLEKLGLKPMIWILYPVYRYFDKVAHATLYAIFGILLNLTLNYSSYILFRKYPSIFSVIIGTLYGVTDEVHQMFVPYRTPSVKDLFADFIGLTSAQILIFICSKLYKILRMTE